MGSNSDGEGNRAIGREKGREGAPAASLNGKGGLGADNNDRNGLDDIKLLIQYDCSPSWLLVGRSVGRSAAGCFIMAE